MHKTTLGNNPVSRRRRTLALLGAAGTGMLAMPAAAQQRPACLLTPAQTEGPYFVDERLQRSDIRSDPADGSLRPGIPLALLLRVSSLAPGGCTPLAGAMVDIWHCDAAGAYAGTAAAENRRFLRGYQLTGNGGDARFTTIYPGWYPGRAVHIHFKVRIQSAAGKPVEFTSQLYFDDAVTSQVMAAAPYAGRGSRFLRNEQDGLYRNGGSMLTTTPRPQDGGYAAVFDIGLRS